MLHLETSIINLQLRRSREAKDAIRKGVEQIHNAKGHGPEWFQLLLLHRWKGNASASILPARRGNGLRMTMFKKRVSKSPCESCQNRGVCLAHQGHLCEVSTFY